MAFGGWAWLKAFNDGTWEVMARRRDFAHLDRSGKAATATLEGAKAAAMAAFLKAVTESPEELP